MRGQTRIAHRSSRQMVSTAKQLFLHSQEKALDKLLCIQHLDNLETFFRAAGVCACDQVYKTQTCTLSNQESLVLSCRSCLPPRRRGDQSC